MMSLEECYRILRLPSGASLREARRAYHELVKIFHPDRHHAGPESLHQATEETKELNLAYERICDLLGAGLTARKQTAAKPGRAEGSGRPVHGQKFVLPSCGIDLNWVAPGRFQMGSPDSEAGRSNDEGPLTNVTIGRGFWLGSRAVTQEEWKAIAVDATGLNPAPGYFRGDRLPVEQVSWDECHAWLRQLNAEEQTGNRLPPGLQYRLPTEAEWEFACRAGTEFRFHFGNDESQLDDYAWYAGNSRSRSHPVGEKKENSGGFFDMHGNVWEW